MIYQKSEQSGYNLHVIKTDKFKTTRFEVKFSEQLKKETATKRALLTLMMMSGSKNYPTQQDVAIKLESLYGASLSSSINSVGLLSVFEIKMSIISDAFLSEPVLKEGIEVLKDRIFNPIFSEEDLKVQKNELKQRIKSVYDNKALYSIKRLIEVVGANKPFSVDVNGYADEIDAITVSDLEQEYQSIISTSNIDIFVVGNLKEEEIEVIKESFKFDNTYSLVEACYCDHSELNFEEVLEEQEINQGKLNIAYRSAGNIKSDNYYAGVIFNTIFGGMSTSKLFMNVREKHSLAYTVQSKFEAMLGLNIVHTGINASDLNKTKEVILDQLNLMKEGSITDSEITLAKKTIINSLLQGIDNKAGIVRFYYSKVITERVISVDEIIERVNNVTKEDIVNYAQEVVVEKTYFLHGGM